MRKLKILIVIFLLLLCNRFLYSEDQFTSFGLQQAGKLLADPPLFFYEFQRNMESTTPLVPGKTLGFNYHFLGGILIVPLPDVTTAANLSGKLQIHPEGRLYPGLPQFDLVGGYWNSVLTSLIVSPNASATDTDTKLKRADLSGYYTGIVMTSSLEPRVRLFWSYKYSNLNIKIDLNKSQNVLGSTVSSFQGGLREHTLSAGIEHTYGENKRWILEGGLGLPDNLITAKVSWYRKYLELGFNIYPESVFIMQPEINFHFNF